MSDDDDTPVLRIYQSLNGPCAEVSHLPLMVGTDHQRDGQQLRLAKATLWKARPGVRIVGSSFAGATTALLWFTE